MDISELVDFKDYLLDMAMTSSEARKIEAMSFEQLNKVLNNYKIRGMQW